MRWRWWLADAEPDRPSLRVKVHIRRTEHRPRIDEVGAESRGKTSHCPSPLTAAEGLIPAHTGKTHGRGLSLLGKKPHPRSRGENAWDPATGASMGAHPRSRGQNRIRARSAISSAGSSPLTRGKPVSCGVVGTSHRLIPAHAGKTCPRWSAPTTRRAHPRSRGENHREASGGLGATELIPAHAGKTIRADR